jgi:hypothetical protein
LALDEGITSSDAVSYDLLLVNEKKQSADQRKAMLEKLSNTPAVFPVGSRVLAMWLANESCDWYVAKVLSYTAPNVYKVEFDDGYGTQICYERELCDFNLEHAEKIKAALFVQRRYRKRRALRKWKFLVSNVQPVEEAAAIRIQRNFRWRRTRRRWMQLAQAKKLHDQAVKIELENARRLAEEKKNEQERQAAVTAFVDDEARFFENYIRKIAACYYLPTSNAKMNVEGVKLKVIKHNFKNHHEEITLHTDTIVTLKSKKNDEILIGTNEAGETGEFKMECVNFDNRSTLLSKSEVAALFGPEFENLWRTSAKLVIEDMKDLQVANTEAMALKIVQRRVKLRNLYLTLVKNMTRCQRFLNVYQKNYVFSAKFQSLFRTCEEKAGMPLLQLLEEVGTRSLVYPKFISEILAHTPKEHESYIDLEIALVKATS